MGSYVDKERADKFSQGFNSNTGTQSLIDKAKNLFSAGSSVGSAAEASPEQSSAAMKRRLMKANSDE